MRNLVDILLVVAVALLLAGLPGSAAETDAQKRLREQAEEQARLKEKWVGQYERLLVQHAQLKASLEQARADYSRGRSTRDLSGKGKAGLIEELQTLEADFAKIDQELADFPDMARREGALPGWFRDVQAPTPAAPDPSQDVGGDGDDFEADDDEPGSSSSRSLRDRSDDRKSRRLGRDD